MIKAIKDEYHPGTVRMLCFGSLPTKLAKYEKILNVIWSPQFNNASANLEFIYKGFQLKAKP